jgi:intracellular sulfur oxidation DsrE/DsrF family protein
MDDREKGPANEKHEDHPLIARRSLLAKMSVGAVAGLAVGAQSVAGQTAPQSFEPARHALDAWMNELPGSHRVFIDSASMHGGPNALRYASNIVTTHEEAYSGTAADLAIVVCFRHESTPYGFDDAMWAKYGASFDSAAKPTTNPMNVATASNGGSSIGSVVAKGVQFAICMRATRAYAGGLARRAGVPVDQVVDELMAGAIPNSRFVPAGVMAVTRSQEYGYSLLYAE